MTCNDCICSDVCYYKSFNDVRRLQKRRNDVEKICKSFIHRDNFKLVEIDQFKNAPTVDAVEVVHGRWKNVKETEVYSPDHRCTFTHTAQTCSVCNVRIGFIGAKFYLYDGYCPNCGAKMDGDGNG